MPGAGRQRFAKHLFRAFAADPSAWTDELMEPYLARLREPAQVRAIRRTCLDFVGPAIVELLRSGRAGQVMPCSTLHLTGALDPVVRADLLGGPAVEAVGVELEEPPGVAHRIVEERPDVVVPVPSRSVRGGARPLRRLTRVTSDDWCNR